MHIENANNVERQKMFDPCKSKYNRKLQIGSDVNEANIQNISFGPNKILIENVASFKFSIKFKKKYFLIQILD